MPSVHRQTLVDLVRDRAYSVGVELGVDKGILTGMLLRQCPDLALTVVDVFPDRVRSRRVFELQAQYPNRLRVLEMTTDDASTLFSDGSFDFVFVDADHSESAVSSDIAKWYRTVREDGWFGGHDYHPRKFPGVVKAVDRFFSRDAVHHWPGTIWGVWT